MPGHAEIEEPTGPGASQTVELVQQLKRLPYTRIELRDLGQDCSADTPRLVQGTNVQRSVQQRAGKGHRQHESCSRCIFMYAPSAIEFSQVFPTTKGTGSCPSKGRKDRHWAVNSQSAFHHHAALFGVLNVLYVRSSRCIAHRTQELPHSMVNFDRRVFPDRLDAMPEVSATAPLPWRYEDHSRESKGRCSISRT